MSDMRKLIIDELLGRTQPRRPARSVDVLLRIDAHDWSEIGRALMDIAREITEQSDVLEHYDVSPSSRVIVSVERDPEMTLERWEREIRQWYSDVRSRREATDEHLRRGKPKA